MPIELAGISNEHEFYSQHYLTSVFEGDVEETFRAWKELAETGAVPPNVAVEKAGTAWRRRSAAFLEERDARKRLLIFREFAHEFLSALGYERRSELVEDAEGKLVPVLARRERGGRDEVWIVEVPTASGADFETDPLQTRFTCEQFEGVASAEEVVKRRKDAAETAVTRGVFGLGAPPRFVVLLCMSQAILIDRNKWADSRLLRFRFSEIFGRGDRTTAGAVAAFLHADSLAPSSGTALVDRIDEESHRHAYGVSKDLKYALREAIELLGNEAASLIVAKRREQGKGVFTGENALDAEVLTTECLRYMYRLLFLFYIEARPELGFAPMRSDAYRKGYSLEGLRELELVPLETEEDRNGHYISDTLETLFRIVFEGTPGTGLKQAIDEEFSFHPVRTSLFAPDATGTYLRGLRFRNETMQRIVELMSLSRSERGRSRGRISYAQLGISQLGAVYESLLSFSGFFASEDLVELKKAGENAPGELEAAFFAPRSKASEFVKDEIVYLPNGEAKVHPKGSFIYRLAGRNRENSASYYTPEPLARVLVKHALDELLEGKTADQILEIKVVEPAMGSAAFLVETVNQLADEYLRRKQKELGKRIPHEEYGHERQKVRAYIADRNVFGVDLNPVAMELGQISLWLDCLHQGGFAPWFVDQVHAGNSLVGARRAAFPVTSLTARSEADRWTSLKPREIGWSGETRGDDEVWHFLLPNSGMSSYDQSTVRPFAPEAWTAFARWRREMCRPLDADETAVVLRLSKAVDRLFDDVADRLREMRSAVNDEIAIWPARAKSDQKRVDLEEKMRRLAKFHGDGVKGAVSWRRLRAAMDAWCALWFWSVDKWDLLPTRAQFLQALDIVLTQGAQERPRQEASRSTPPQGRLFETVLLPAEQGSGTLFQASERAVLPGREDLFADVDVDELIAASPWLETAMEVAKRHRFMHFDLEFADVMRERGGFDLVIGNPPWLKPTWVDAHVLSEKEPSLGVREVSASDVEKRKSVLFEADPGLKNWYLHEYVEMGGLQAFLSSPSCYPHLAGGQPNLYKCFMDLAFRITARTGVAALIHQDNHLSDPDAGTLRRTWYRRIRRHFHFRNAITRRMFAEVSDPALFIARRWRPTICNQVSTSAYLQSPRV